jgi:hypothetical protein
MLLPPFVQLRFRIWQRTGFDPQIEIRLGWLAKGTKSLLAWWDVIGTMAAAGGLGWYCNNEAASAMTILLPVALLAVALIVVGFSRQENCR